MFNFWGTTLVDPASTSHSSTRGLMPSIVGGLEENMTALKGKIQRQTQNKYTLWRVETCGSSANTIAVVTATQGRIDACIFAVGSYIAGDQAFFNELSLMNRQPEEHSLFLPMKAQEASREQIRHHAPLPYYLPSSVDKEQFLTTACHQKMSDQGVECLHEYEDRCLQSLHCLLITRRVHGNPVRAIFLEPVLAGNGGMLSYRCLKILAHLAEVHDFVFIIDEILTFGRTGHDSGLYSMEYFPDEMHKRVSMIIIGKWIGHGCILRRMTAIEQSSKKKKARTKSQTVGRKTKPMKPELAASMSRVVSTRPNTFLLNKTWDDVFSKTQLIAPWRETILHFVGVLNPDDHWGIGLLIFIAGKLKNKSGIMNGLQSRLLPKINHETNRVKVGAILMGISKSSFSPMPQWSRENLNQALVQSILEYCFPAGGTTMSISEKIVYNICIEYQKMGVFCRDKDDIKATQKKLDAYDATVDDILASVVRTMQGDFQSVTTRKQRQPKFEIIQALNKMKDHREVMIHQKTKATRMAVWRAGPLMVYWQLLLDLDPVSLTEEEEDEEGEIGDSISCPCGCCELFRQVTFPPKERDASRKRPLSPVEDRDNDKKPAAK
jgi:hypothetical protein